MKIDFSYEKGSIPYTSGYIQKGKNYRCNYIKFKSPYKNAKPGTETIELYNFEPKTPATASVMVIPGLGTRNIKFLLWLGSHLACSKVSCNVLTLPGNYTRVEKGSVSGKNYVYPDIDIIYNTWQHAVVDIQSSMDFLEEKGLWKEKNCILGYCLGGMISSIISSIDSRINETILLNTGGHFPKIIHESAVGKFARRMFKKGYETDYFLHDKIRLYEAYDRELPLVRNMELKEFLSSDEIHPLFKVDPLSYAHFLDKKNVTFIDAIYDETLPIISRSMLFKELKGSTRYLLPATHGLLLPFEFFIAQYIMLKLNIKEVKDLKLLIPNKLKIPIISDLLQYFTNE
ncbi:alpha/beta hydrolase [Hathewaya histolytica]|uniref:Putative hydrolase or acyltransferase of alpha/beta superfamily n=1 Tax=Hathewaya histolytica TaxID=1498 RepID=A0A4U9QXZ6_HATHI|nr:alpha/beta hydrolase [Hathewaya histolytica]VTQ83676.1 putative hydrolase or acyltransferase of alpha/beta superfamily [Hathewaya histolytica]